jgi:hypothetical protein
MVDALYVLGLRVLCVYVRVLVCIVEFMALCKSMAVLCALSALRESTESAVRYAASLSQCDELRQRLQAAVAEERQLRSDAERKRDDLLVRSCAAVVVVIVLCCWCVAVLVRA